MDPARLKADASAALAAGQFARAGSLYATYCAGAPRDRQSHLRMGDAWARAGDTPRAIDAYLAAAQGFAEDGFLARAIAASKLVLELDPRHTQMQRILADLYARRAAGGQTLRAMLAGTATGSHAPVTAEAPQTPPAPPLPVDPEALSAEPLSADPGEELDIEPAPEPLRPESPAVLMEEAPPSVPGRPTPPELVVTEYLLEPDPSEQTLEDVLAVEAEREADPSPRAPEPDLLELDAPAPPPPAPELGPRFLELSLEDAGSPVLDVESVLLPDAVAVAVATPEHPGEPPYVDLFADEAEAPDELSDGPLLHALEDAEDHPPLEAAVASNPFVAPSARSVPRTPLFSDLSPEAFVELVERSPLRRYRGGDRIVHQGDPGTSFFVICEGRVSVLREEDGVARPLAALEAGEFFGEVALLAGGPRIASVDALADDTQVLEIPGAVLLGLARRHPGVGAALKTFCRQRLLANLLATSPLFRPLDRTERRALAARFRARDALPQEVVVSEGTRADGLYVILAGEMEVLREEAEVSRLSTGDVFGEMSLLDEVGANASVRALRRTSLLRLPTSDVDDVLERYPAVRQHLEALRNARAEINTRLPFVPGDEPMLVV